MSFEPLEESAEWYGGRRSVAEVEAAKQEVLTRLAGTHGCIYSDREHSYRRGFGTAGDAVCGCERCRPMEDVGGRPSVGGGGENG